MLGMPRSTSTPSIAPAPTCRRCQTLGFAGGSLGKKRKGRSHGLLLLGCGRTPRIWNPRSTVLLLKWHDFLSTWEFFKWIHAIQGTYSPKPVARRSTCLCQFSTLPLANHASNAKRWNTTGKLTLPRWLRNSPTQSHNLKENTHPHFWSCPPPFTDPNCGS